MTIVCDTRQQIGKHDKKNAQMKSLNCCFLSSKLPVGDYILYDNLPDDLKLTVKNANEIYALGGSPKPKIQREISEGLLKYSKISVDTKKDIQEIVGNVTKDHARFVRECDLAEENGIKLIILIEDEKVSCINDLYKWYNYRLRFSPRATTGKTLAKILHGMEVRHGVKFEFCKKADSGKKIIELLGGSSDNK